jgi:D-alanine-D-alanine ligase
VVPIYISPEGSWYFWAGFMQGVARPGDEDPAYTPVADPGRRAFLTRLDAGGDIEADVAFPLLHGPYGEDGTVQGLLELAAMPYVGSGPLAAALAMDKELSKNGISTVDYFAVARRRFEKEPERVTLEVEQRLRYPVFVKPANLGSSIGIHKAKDRESLRAALTDAARYDGKILCEQAVKAREFECAVLGNDEPEASPVGEIVPAGEFYDYDAKYVKDDAELLAPADVNDGLSQRVRDLAVRAFASHNCAGLARVDFFYLPDNDLLLVNEINTMPGFTPISMYPKLWEVGGLPYARLIERLVDLAFEKHADRMRNLIRYENAVDVK